MLATQQLVPFEDSDIFWPGHSSKRRFGIGIRSMHPHTARFCTVPRAFDPLFSDRFARSWRHKGGFLELKIVSRFASKKSQETRAAVEHLAAARTTLERAT
jgi:hypothetical protein